MTRWSERVNTERVSGSHARTLRGGWSAALGRGVPAVANDGHEAAHPRTVTVRMRTAMALLHGLLADRNAQ